MNVKISVYHRMDLLFLSLSPALPRLGVSVEAKFTREAAGLELLVCSLSHS